MKAMATLFFALVAAVGLSAVPARAQHGGGHPGGPPGGMPGMGHDSGMSGTGHGEGTNQPMSNKPGVTTGKQSINDILSRNRKLSSRISTLTGMNAQSACSGFKNLGQCVAAAEVSHNLAGACTFTALKTGTLAPHGSLGKAIHGCDPQVNAKSEARKAEGQAKRDIHASGG